MATAKQDEIAWNVHKDESPDRLVFDTVGDSYTGYYLGTITIDPKENDPESKDEPFQQIQWRDYAAPHAPKSTNAGYQLEKAYADLEKAYPDTWYGLLTRTALVKEIDVGQQSDMKDFKVEAAPNEPRYADRIGK